ncbi:hypothetical protein [Chryseobacterium kwangjuense]|uniref:Uncharacterized protein n=1 Tax=Chryseobacterium kwangjuense TaxID=267125 RepID=A0A135WJE0_9FLAO|nr:hypothetical protein [Chryseobacterium kwangjuense]KXH84995.1 hypothetical protein AU378_04360 [Chryseobacterium kwangjuense]
MAQSETEIIFSNENSGNPALYVYDQAGPHWTALLLPDGSTYTDPTISLQVAAKQQVYFLFATKAPADTKGFIERYRPYLLKFRQNVTANLTTAWLNNPDQIPSTNNTTVLNFAQFGTTSPFVVGQPFSVTIGKGFGTLTITNNTVMQLQPDNDSPNALRLIWVPGNPNMSFANKTLGTNSIFRSDITIPFSGPGTGSFRFLLGLNMNLDFKGYGLQNNYYYGDSTNPSYFAYPILKAGSTNDFLITQTEIDLLDIANSDGLNTYFAITGQIYNTNTGQTKAAGLPSYYAINTGYPLTLWPAVDMADSGAPVNNLFPTDHSARFVISPRDSAGTQPYYLSPEGDFYLDPGASQAAFADENGQYSLLPGLSGTEVISFTPYENNAGSITGDTIRFTSKQAAFAANFPGQEVSLANPGTDKPVLDSTYLTAWANIIASTPGNVQYASQPQGASLFAKGHGIASPDNNITGFLGFYEPSVDMPQTNGFAVPLAPYLGVNPVPPPSAEGIGTFESKVLSAERKGLISAAFTTPRASKSQARRTMAKAGASDYTASATPQGLVANVNNNGGWSLLNLAQNTVNNGPPEYLNPESQVPATPPQYQLSFINLMPQMQSAFLTNQQFLVVTNNQYLGELFSTMNTPGGGSSSQPVFNNKMSIEDWPFDLNVGVNNTYADYNNILIFKFCKGTIIDRVKNPKEWTQANAFNIDQNNTDPATAYNQLVAVSSWLQTYLEEAEDAYNKAVADPASGQLEYYQKFHNIINDPNWNGILALKATIDLQEFPQQLKGLISGINLKNFYAHHFGIEVNRVDASDVITMDPISSLFGLINYVDPAYAQQIAQGLNPNKPVQPAAGATYDFKVLFLQVLFENTAIKDFASKLQLTMNNLFSDKVTGTNNPYGSNSLNTVVLNGTYQDHNGTPVYVFDNKDDNLFYFDSNLLTNVEITKIQFNTLTTDPAALDIQSRFTMWGYLNFDTMVAQAATEDGTAYSLDAFSFGLPLKDDTLQQGLNYSNLYVNMAFNLNTPTVTTYAFDASQIAFNSSQSNARTNSLYPNFALQINKLLSGNDDSAPSGQGYLKLALPGINATGLAGDWYGLQMTLNMGSPGELASSTGFNASLLIAWSPGSKSASPGYNAFVGIKLPGTSSNAKLLSIQGVLKLTIDKLSLQYVTDQQSYLLTLSNIALKLLGILKLPPGGNTDFLLFGNPDPGATAKSLGWYAAYNKNV